LHDIIDAPQDLLIDTAVAEAALAFARIATAREPDAPRARRAIARARDRAHDTRGAPLRADPAHSDGDASSNRIFARNVTQQLASAEHGLTLDEDAKPRLLWAIERDPVFGRSDTVRLKLGAKRPRSSF